MFPPFPVVANRNGRIIIGLSTDIRQKSGELTWPHQVGNYLGPNGRLVGIYHGPRHACRFASSFPSEIPFRYAHNRQEDSASTLSVGKMRPSICIFIDSEGSSPNSLIAAINASKAIFAAPRGFLPFPSFFFFPTFVSGSYTGTSEVTASPSTFTCPVSTTSK